MEYIQIYFLNSKILQYFLSRNHFYIKHFRQQVCKPNFYWAMKRSKRYTSYRMYTTIIFDFFGVIHNNQYSEWLSRHGVERTGQFAELSDKANVGKISIKEFFDGIAKLSGQNYEEVKNEFQVNTRLDPKVIDVIEFLRKSGYKIGLLSNASSGYIYGVKGFKEISELFDEIIVSGDVGMAKPDPKFFDFALKKLGCKPSETIFIDDGYSNVEASNALGIKGIHFTNVDNLIKDLDQKLLDKSSK